MCISVCGFENTTEFLKRLAELRAKLINGTITEKESENYDYMLDYFWDKAEYGEVFSYE